METHHALLALTSNLGTQVLLSERNEYADSPAVIVMSETTFERFMANSKPKSYAYNNKKPAKTKEELVTEIELLFCEQRINLKKFIPLVAALEFNYHTVTYRNKLIREKLTYHQRSGHLSAGPIIPTGELADWIQRDKSFKNLNKITSVVNARPLKIQVQGLAVRTLVGQVRVTTKPDPDNFEDALAAYIESDFEVQRLMVENSNLKQQLGALLKAKEIRAESNRENARQTRRKRN